MRSKDGWLLMGILLVGVIAFGRRALYSLSDQFVVGTPKIQFGNFDFVSITGNILIPVQNRTNLSATINNFIGDLVYQGRAIAHLDMPAAVQVNALSDFTLNIQVVLNTVNLTTQIVDIIKNKAFGTDLRVVGYLVINGYRLPVDEPVSV